MPIYTPGNGPAGMLWPRHLEQETQRVERARYSENFTGKAERNDVYLGSVSMKRTAEVAPKCL